MIRAKPPRSPTFSDTDIVVDTTSPDSDVPLSTLKGRRKQLRKTKKIKNHHNAKNKNESKSRHTGATTNISSVSGPASTITSSAYKNEDLPSCSSYCTESRPNDLADMNGTPLDLVISNRSDCGESRVPNSSNGVLNYTKYEKPLYQYNLDPNK